MNTLGMSIRTRPALCVLGCLAVAGLLEFQYGTHRGPELVQWTSPPLAPSGKRIRFMVPSGWELSPYFAKNSLKDGKWVGGAMCVVPEDHRPEFMWRLQLGPEFANILILINPTLGPANATTVVQHTPYGWFATRTIKVDGGKMTLRIEYGRQNVRAFDRTYKQICDSMTIE